MEERNLDLNDDGKIRLRKYGEGAPEGGAPGEGSPDEIIVDVPDFPSADPFAEGEEDELAREEGVRAAHAADAQMRAAYEAEREGRRLRARRLYDEAERLYAAGDLDAAGEKYLDSGALYGADWRPWFGVVRVQTRDFTDFSAIYDCQQAYDKALRRMKPEERAAIAACYVPRLEQTADECAVRQEQLSAEDERIRAEARPAVLREYKLSRLLFAAFAALFLLFAVAGGVLAMFINAVQGWQILIPAVICLAVALVLLVVLAVCTRRFVRARGAKVRNARAGSTPQGEEARICAETEEIARSIIEDLTK